MVRLHVKKGDDSQFLYDTHVEANVDDVVRDIVVIYNGRLKISRICYGKFVLFTKADYSRAGHKHTFWKFRIISAIGKNHSYVLII